MSSIIVAVARLMQRKLLLHLTRVSYLSNNKNIRTVLFFVKVAHRKKKKEKKSLTYKTTNLLAVGTPLGVYYRLLPSHVSRADGRRGCIIQANTHE